MKDLWAVQSIISCRKYPRSLSGVRDLINFVGKKPIEDHPTAREGAGEPRANGGGAVPRSINLRLGIAWEFSYSYSLSSRRLVPVGEGHNAFIEAQFLHPVDTGEFKCRPFC